MTYMSTLKQSCLRMAENARNAGDINTSLDLSALAVAADGATLIEAPMLHHVRGLSYTASGYGAKIPTTYKIKVGARVYRVYCAVFSNIGTTYILALGHKLALDVSDHK